MENLIYLPIVLLAPLFLYTIVWWFPLIFISGLITGEAFKKDSYSLLSPFCMLEMIFKDNITVARIIGIFYSITSFMLSWLVYNDTKKIGPFILFFLFVGILMLLGIIFSLFRKNK